MQKQERDMVVGVVHYMLTSPTYSLVISCTRESEDSGTEEEKVLIVASQCCGAAASAPCVTLSVSLINEPQAPMRPSRRDSADQYTPKAWPRGSSLVTGAVGLSEASGD